MPAGTINWDDLNGETKYRPVAAYKQSKTCNLLFTLELAERLKEMDVKVFSVSPGVVFTQLGRYTRQSLGFWYTLVSYPFMKLLFRTPREGAQTTLFCCLDETIADKSGKFFRNLKEAQMMPHAESKVDAERLWSVSLEFVKKFLPG